jgi:hypothetical protein
MRSEMKLPKMKTAGKIKAEARNEKIKEFGPDTAKGKNKDWAKEANKKTLPSADKSRRASVKEASSNTAMQKHPLIRNAGEASAEGKYRGNRGKPVPVKKIKTSPKKK